MLPEAVDDSSATFARNRLSTRYLVFKDFSIMWFQPDDLAILFYWSSVLHYLFLLKDGMIVKHSLDLQMVCPNPISVENHVAIR